MTEARQPVQVLLIEDSSDDAELIRRALTRGGFNVTSQCVREASTLRAALADGPWDVVLSDHVLPGFSSAEAFQMVRSEWPDAPFIVVSGHIGEDAVASALRAGADDFVSKDHLEVLPSAVARILSSAKAKREREELATALRTSQARLRALLEHAPFPITLKDADGRFVEINRFAAASLGGDRDAIIGKTPEELYDSPDVAAAIEEQERPIREGRGPITFDLSTTTPEGTARDYLITKYPVVDEGGSVTGVGGISLDVTDLHAAQRALRESQAATRGIIDNSPDAFVAADSDGRIIDWNPAAEAMFGWTAEEALNRKLTDTIIAPELRQQHADGLARVASGAPARMIGRQLDLPAVRRDGQRLTVAVTISETLRSGEREFHAFLRDVTQQRIDQQRVQDAEELFRLSFESAPIGMALVAPDGRFLRVNEALAQITGYAQHDLLGLTFQDISHPDDLDADLDYVRSVLDGQLSSYAMEKRYIRADGQTVWVQLSVSLVRHPDGRPRHFISQIEDIDRRKHLEEGIREANTRLDAANQAKDRFLASMSHELRTPLNAIIGFTGILLQELAGPLTPDQSKQLTIIKNSGSHLLSLINELLDLSRIESGKVQLTPETIDCRELVDEVITGLEPLAKAKDLSVTAWSAQQILVEADRRALSQILINLITNAIKFTDRGDVRVSIAQRGIEGGVQTRFDVADTGRGIKAADQKKLFQAFAQVGEPGRNPYDGTGLGLYISQSLAQLLGGEITFRSVDDVGSVFSLTLTRKPNG